MPQLIEAAHRVGVYIKYTTKTSKEHVLVTLSDFLATQQGKDTSFIKWPIQKQSQFICLEDEEDQKQNQDDDDLGDLSFAKPGQNNHTNQNNTKSLENQYRQLNLIQQIEQHQVQMDNQDNYYQQSDFQNQVQISDYMNDDEKKKQQEMKQYEKQLQKLVLQEKQSKYKISEDFKDRLHQITLNDIIQDMYTPTIADHNDDLPEIQCICWVDKYRQDRTTLIQCSKCQSKQHLKCKTVGNNAMKQKLMMFCKKEFDIPHEFERYLLLKHEVLFLEVRCVRLDGFKTLEEAKSGNFKQQWPNRGWFSFNYRRGREFVLPKQMNTQLNPTDNITLAGIGLEREIRDEEIFDVSAYLKEGSNFIEICKFDDCHTYSCALYLTKLINIFDISRYIRTNKVDSIFSSYEKVKLRVAQNKYFSKERINLRCPITQSRLKLPARGEKCNHLSCFEAESFYWINSKCKKWICPICCKPTYELTVDKFMIMILEKANLIYPLEFNLINLPRPEVIKVLQREINIGSQEDRVIDSNDIEFCELNPDLSVSIGVRQYILNDKIEPNKMIEVKNDDPQSMSLSFENLDMIAQLRKDFKKTKKKEQHLVDVAKYYTIIESSASSQRNQINNIDDDEIMEIQVNNPEQQQSMTRAERRKQRRQQQRQQQNQTVYSTSQNNFIDILD
ncbi:e3 sumo-protein ligase pias4 [Stylonychia lemnae]|uniref:E3 sumo-protein ligase pias4 n=1 Tax=Stylonychia lemnae TaxID=5949 RepID=A0A078A3H4_STYLE|nr:e3 sumo-protein ligase pias4 [Stylonychia lemnae]|eukprot:CDW76347.1 e3 sumo-protein ligase pias4 [Stylonychia lemnae]